MKSKTILGADGATKMRQITVGIHGKGSKLYSCTGYDCREPYRRAYEYALSHIRERQET